MWLWQAVYHAVEKDLHPSLDLILCHGLTVGFQALQRYDLLLVSLQNAVNICDEVRQMAECDKLTALSVAFGNQNSSGIPL